MTQKRAITAAMAACHSNIARPVAARQASVIPPLDQDELAAIFDKSTRQLHGTSSRHRRNTDELHPQSGVPDMRDLLAEATMDVALAHRLQLTRQFHHILPPPLWKLPDPLSLTSPPTVPEPHRRHRQVVRSA